MEAVKFTLSGRNAFFKKPEVNAYYYLHIAIYIRLLC